MPTLEWGEGIPGTGIYVPAGLWWGSHRELDQHLKKRVWLCLVWGQGTAGSALGQIGLVTMGEVAGMVFCGWVLRKQTFRQGVLRDQQGQSPWLGLRHR